jgi:predicted esterase
LSIIHVLFLAVFLGASLPVVADGTPRKSKKPATKASLNTPEAPTESVIQEPQPSQVQKTPARAASPAPVSVSLPPVQLPSDPQDSYREQWRFVTQRRIGRYRVMLPAGMQPGRRYPLVILFHGNGNSPSVMLNWARELKLDSTMFICPEAPYVKLPETMSSGAPRYTAMADAMGIGDTVSPEAVSLSADWYYDVIRDAQRTLPVDTLEKPSLIGFSQGGFYSHVVMTRHPDAFSSVASICASMYPEGKVFERYAGLRSFDLEVLVAHGRQDTVVPFQTGENIKNALESAGLKPLFVPFDGGHWPSPVATERIRQWLLSRRK